MTRTSLIKRFLGFSSALALTLLLTSCDPESVNPLGSPEPSAADSRLEGNWRDLKEPQKSLIFTGKQIPWLHVLSADLARDSADDAEYNVYPTVIGKAHILNIQRLSKDDNGEAKRFYFFRYEIASDDTLSLWGMNEQLVIKAIEGGKLKGSIEKKSSDTNRDVTLTDSTANLVKFIEKSGPEKVFSQESSKYRKAPPLKPIRIEVDSGSIKLDGEPVTDGRSRTDPLAEISKALAKRKAESGADDPVVIRFSAETPVSLLLQIREIALKTHPSVHLVFEEAGNPPTLKELNISDASGRILK